METREINSLNYNNQPQTNQESSPRLSSATLNFSPSSNTIRNETPSNLLQRNHYHGFMLQKEKPEAQRPIRNSNLDPDPVTQIPQASTQPPLPPSITARGVAAVVVRYRECLKNHAASRGAHVLDGCGEFMPNGDDNTPEALKCAACECHRSFHRREVEGESQSTYHTQHIAQPPRATAVQLPPAPAPAPQPQRQRYHHPMPPMMMAFGGGNGAPAESSSEDLNIFRTYDGVQLTAQTSKKRFRTKFTQEQKDKMHDFAERIGWKIQKQDEHDVLRFCNEVGLKKQVFKVWMHNNKQATKKNEL
uniref:zinc-finger homeodomain protein 6-like n=1 Tax=Erigeron canadensis TaxID=72917 RepID=UPI001CB901CC|nr:zinc-finger homeodomain protein 6-like [Erigeron canadensis]